MANSADSHYIVNYSWQAGQVKKGGEGESLFDGKKLLNAMGCIRTVYCLP
jgi:hypothetical protein